MAPCNWETRGDLQTAWGNPDDNLESGEVDNISQLWTVSKHPQHYYPLLPLPNRFRNLEPGQT